MATRRVGAIDGEGGPTPPSGPRRPLQIVLSKRSYLLVGVAVLISLTMWTSWSRVYSGKGTPRPPFPVRMPFSFTMLILIPFWM